MVPPPYCCGCTTPSYVTGFGGWLTNAGRITGLLAGYLVILLLALMARIPALERGVGTDTLARWHASIGRYTVCLAVAHTLLIIWGYAVTAHTNVVSQTTTLVLSYPDVLMATVSLGLLVMVGTVSARAARKRLRYETWHLLHLYTYLAVALAFSHQFATGADFVDNRAGALSVVGHVHRGRCQPALVPGGATDPDVTAGPIASGGRAPRGPQTRSRCGSAAAIWIGSPPSRASSSGGAS